MTDTSTDAVERLAWGLDQRIEFIDKGHGNVGEYLDSLFEKAAAALRALLAERDMWRNENAKKQAACEQMGARITALEAERDRLKDALLQIASSGVDGENLNLSHVGHAGCINVAQNALKENDQ